jgi:hypothetical protein
LGLYPPAPPTPAAVAQHPLYSASPAKSPSRSRYLNSSPSNTGGSALSSPGNLSPASGASPQHSTGSAYATPSPGPSPVKGVGLPPRQPSEELGATGGERYTADGYGGGYTLDGDGEDFASAESGGSRVDSPTAGPFDPYLDQHRENSVKRDRSQEGLSQSANHRTGSSSGGHGPSRVRQDDSQQSHSDGDVRPSAHSRRGGGGSEARRGADIDHARHRANDNGALQKAVASEVRRGGDSLVRRGGDSPSASGDGVSDRLGAQDVEDVGRYGSYGIVARRRVAMSRQDTSNTQSRVCALM